MDKTILEQYNAMTREREDLRRRIQSLNAQILNMKLDFDTVSVGKRGKKSLGNKKIQGTTSITYSRKKTAMQVLILKYQELEEELDNKIIEVEDYIQTIKDSRIRTIMRLRYVERKNGRQLTWAQVASRMNETEDSCRKAHDRYLADQ